MNNAAALHELNRALAHFRRRQDHLPTPNSAREIAQMATLAEYLYIAHDHDAVQPLSPQATFSARQRTIA